MLKRTGLLITNTLLHSLPLCVYWLFHPHSLLTFLPPPLFLLLLPSLFLLPTPLWDTDIDIVVMNEAVEETTI